MSTNGTRLSRLAAPLRDAGVSSVNISLDTLNPEQYRRITGGDGIGPAGIEAAVFSGIPRIKLNCVSCEASTRMRFGL